MGSERQIKPGSFDRDTLTGAMVGIGMQFAASPAPMPNIEDTLVATSIEGTDRSDLRVLSVLTTWIDVHSLRVNVDRLERMLLSGEGPFQAHQWRQEEVVGAECPERQLIVTRSSQPADIEMAKL